MDATEKRNRMMCNKCRFVFDYADAAVKHINFHGIQIPEKRCPECGGTFRSIEVPEELDRYLFVDKDKRYYNY